MTRDDKGRFAKGNGGGPGRPKKEREARYYDVLVSTISIDDWRAIIKRAIQDAKRGDTAARKFIADYLIGPPIERKELTGENGGPLTVKVVYDE